MTGISESEAAPAVGSERMFEVVTWYSRRGLKIANLIAVISIAIALALLVSVLLVLSLWKGSGSVVLFFSDWEVTRSFGNLIGFYVVTCGWGIVIGAVVGCVKWMNHRLARRCK